jgi:small-conductance mechanosensitive channel
MFPHRIGRTRIVVLGAVLACAGSEIAAEEGRPEEVLAKLGLKKAGDLWILGAEAEVRSKLDEAKRLSSQLSRALVQQRGMLSEQDRKAMLKELNTRVSQLRSELKETNQQMRQVPRAGAGRRPNYFFNSLAADQYAELMAQRDELQAELDQRTAVLGQLKGQSFDPKARAAIDDQVRDRREALHQAVADLRRLVDATRERYAELAKAPELQQAREALERTSKARLKLGPSREFLANGKLLDRLEKWDSPDGAGEEKSTPARKPRRLPGSKRASKPAAGRAAPGSPS